MDLIVRRPLYYRDLDLDCCYDFGDVVAGEEEAEIVDDDVDRLGWAIYSKESIELFN